MNYLTELVIFFDVTLNIQRSQTTEIERISLGYMEISCIIWYNLYFANALITVLLCFVKQPAGGVFF